WRTQCLLNKWAFYYGERGVVKIDKKMSYAEIIASIMLLGSGLLTAERGLFWVVETDESMVDSNVYTTWSYVMRFWSWGLVFAIGGTLIILASWRLPNRDTAISFAWLLLIGGLVSSVAYFIITIAGFGNAANWLTPVQYITLSGMNGMLAFLGGLRVWQMKNM